MSDREKQMLTSRQKAFLADNPGAEIITTTQPENGVEKSLDANDAAQKHDLIGIGGWLLAFVILQSIGVLRSLADVGTALDNGELPTGFVVILAVYVAIFAFMIFRLASAFKKSTIDIVVACLWMKGPLLEVLTILLFGNYQGSGLVLFATSLSAAIWTAYFLMSVRVKNTYDHTSKELDD